MARIVARKDSAEGYVYIWSTDDYAIPEEARTVIRRHGGEFSGKTEKWRVGITRGPAVVDQIRGLGHDVLTVSADQPRRRGPLECAACGAPYRVNTMARAGESCWVCSDPLVLVEPEAPQRGAS